jgi:hypothetical protein
MDLGSGLGRVRCGWWWQIGVEGGAASRSPPRGESGSGGFIRVLFKNGEAGFSS